MSAGEVVDHPVDPLALYSISAPVSTPETLSAPLLVILSAEDEPVSEAKATVGAATTVS